jgi:hypothetical protein
MFDIDHNPSNPYYRKPQFKLPDKWTKIHKLLNRTNFPIFTKDDGVHFFDKQLGKNKYLVRPIEAPFKDWRCYKVIAGKIGNSNVKQDTAKHYYHYWQVYQVIEIQRYLDFCCKMTLSDNSDYLQKKSYPIYYHIPFPRKKVSDGDYLGVNDEFDALSFFVRVSNRKEIQAFEKGRPIGGGYKRLSTRQSNALERVQKKVAEKTCVRYGLDNDRLWRFLRFILELHENYEKQEKAKLAKEMSQDVLHCMRLIMLKTGLSSLEVSKKIGRVGGYFKDYLEIIFPNKLEQAKEKASPTIESFLKDYNSAFPSNTIGQDSIERLLAFCEKNEANGFVTALSDINREWFSMHSLSGDALISGLRECTCFPEKIGEVVVKKTRKRRIKTAMANKRYTLKTVIQEFFSQEVWISALMGMWRNKSSFNNIQDFAQKYAFLTGNNVLSRDNEEDNILRAILLTSLVRNYVVHRNASFRLLEEKYIFLVRNASFVIFLLWHQTQKRGLIKCN